MPKGKWTQAVWLVLAAFVVFSVMVLIEAGPRIIGKSYTESDDFRNNMNFFYDQIGPYVLNPVEPEEAKKSIGVTEEELDEHRYRYGELDIQLNSIHDQYESQINEAENEEARNTLIAERDAKMEDIRKNFSDDEHVAGKVRVEKGQVIDEYMKALQENRPSFEHHVRHVYYELTDTATGETYTNGNIREEAAYKRTFSEKDGYLRASQIAGDLDYTGEAGSLIPDEVKTFEGTVIVPQAVLNEAADRGIRDEVYLNDDQLAWGYTVFKAEQRAYVGVWLAGILALALLLTVFRLQPSVWTGNRMAMKLERFPIDVVTAAAAVASLIAIAFAEYMKETFMNFVHHTGNFLYSELAVNAVFFVLALGVAVLLILHVVRRFSDSERIGQDLEQAYIRRAADDMRAFFLNRKLGTQVLFLLVVIFLAGLGFGGVFLSFMLGLNIGFALSAVWLFLFFTVALPVLFFMIRRTGYLNRIIDATGRMAAGRLTEEIPVKGTNVFARHAADLNRLREGVRLSMSEQARSERLKTELITNVSHDLRTPLTSIITYTDLLKKPDLSAEERAEYVDVLDRKSQRLKTLIDDLFDVSKMATGNVELNRQRVDLVELVRQAIAEHGEEIAASPLDFRVSIADGPLPASVDGQKWWRVIDNLIQNALKYAMPGTRVYVSLDEAEGVSPEVRFTIKNVSRYELGDSADELFERFKRGDASRHTEGSGLGLAIAQSIVDLHGGRMTIDLDGDLFKVTVAVPRA
ncbi:Sensor protein kinase walK [Bhargavaea cecembensis DSE10]|uniref:histidine kinase n=1 Tax=Bhargavaea cecembensis DSE10 TaxID=1235279 RepID=M7P6M0_9BACL|nr:HAMP domain-containing sensor histidine kinase [Bhargavaea cecembensis]EMR06174.1 Sensor protein kinase walK [Bhargavaea cecembensis DSE10]